MHLCYVDESGTPDLPGNTSHFVLAGIALPIHNWKDSDEQISGIKDRFRLQNTELHTAWIARAYQEQNKIHDFDKLDDGARRVRVEQYRKAELLRLQRSGNSSQYRQTKKSYKHTAPYIHLTHAERMDYLRSVGDCVSHWSYARLFAECIDKIHFDSSRSTATLDEQAFEQVVSRLELYLENTRNRQSGDRNYGLLIHDNNQTTARRHTLLMKRFHRRGTLFTRVTNIIETPLFVDSQLTSMVQVADLCSYALRRYLENNESDLFQRIFRIADKNSRGVVVGVRHFTKKQCSCEICVTHRAAGNKSI